MWIAYSPILKYNFPKVYLELPIHIFEFVAKFFIFLHFLLCFVFQKIMIPLDNLMKCFQMIEILLRSTPNHLLKKLGDSVLWFVHFKLHTYLSDSKINYHGYSSKWLPCLICAESKRFQSYFKKSLSKENQASKQILFQSSFNFNTWFIGCWKVLNHLLKARKKWPKSRKFPQRKEIFFSIFCGWVTTTGVSHNNAFANFFFIYSCFCSIFSSLK